jgi:hypothetical protein
MPSWSVPALIWGGIVALAVIWFWWGLRYDKRHPEEAKARRAAYEAKRADKRKAAHERRIARVREQMTGDDFRRQRAQEEAQRLALIKCPTCQQAGARRVGIGERAGSAVAGGLLLSRKARAQFQCTYCGYLW